jgi:hypothetical protein
MTTFEFISIISVLVILVGTIIGVYIRNTVVISRLEVKISEMERDQTRREIAVLLAEKNLREDFQLNKEAHEKIIDKIDHLAEQVNKR